MLNILVCVKQVPDAESPITISDSSQWVRLDQVSDFRMNRWDESAVEEAILIKGLFSDTKIDIISVGPPRADVVIRRALGMGADDGIHIVTQKERDPEPFTTASWIALFAGKKNYDLTP